jgi:hypothetical protein
MRSASTWALMIGLSGWPTPTWAAAPVEPSEPIGDAALEPEPNLAPLPQSALEPQPAPVPAPAPELEPEGAYDQPPAYDQPLPSYDELPIAPTVTFDGLPIDAEPEDPPTGRGRTAVGSILLGGGVALMSVSGTMFSRGTDPALWLSGALIGSGSIAAGVTLVLAGHVRHKRYRSWASAHADAPVPPRGDGLLAGGLTCMIAGSMGTIIGGVSVIAFQDEDDPPYGQVLVPLGLVSVVTGVGLLVGAGMRRKQFDRWEAGRVVPSISLLPGTRAPGRAQSIGGLSLGVAGRF